jgi:hypothetical protein
MGIHSFMKISLRNLPLPYFAAILHQKAAFA